MSHNTLIASPVEKHNAALDEIETLIDAWTVGGLLDLMAEVASAKADHIRANWQDEKTADAWDNMATKLLQCQQSILTQR